MMMIGGLFPPSAADSYDAYDIFTGSGLVLNDRPPLDGACRRHSRDKRDAAVAVNDALDLIIAAL
jgi:hypothetical protein